MTDYHRDFIYCSGLLPVQSLDAVLAVADNKVRHYRDPADLPDLALIKKRDGERLHAWLARLAPHLAEVARLLMAGLTQSEIARRLKLTEAAISKRVNRIREAGAREIFDLADTPLLN